MRCTNLDRTAPAIRPRLGARRATGVALWLWIAASSGICQACVPLERAPATSPPAASGTLRARDFFPLAIGNRWSYSAGFAGANQTLTVAIVAHQGSVYQDSRGLQFILDRDGLRDDKRYLLKEPLELGQSWTSVVDLATSEHYKISELGVSVDVPAGHFDGCLRVEGRNPAQGVVLIVEQTFCPGVGLTKLITFVEKGAERGPPQFFQDLTSFNVKP